MEIGSRLWNILHGHVSHVALLARPCYAQKTLSFDKCQMGVSFPFKRQDPMSISVRRHVGRGP